MRRQLVAQAPKAPAAHVRGLLLAQLSHVPAEPIKLLLLLRHDLVQVIHQILHKARLDTHQSKVKVGSDTKFIVIDQLSTVADINSLQISVPEDVALLSHRYSVFYPVLPPVVKTREMERLEDSIILLQKDISRIDNLIIIEQEILTKTGTLIETTVNANGGKTAIMTSDELLKLVEYYNTKIEKAKTNIYNQPALTTRKKRWKSPVKSWC